VLDDATAVQVVDVRQVNERVALDLAVFVDDLAIWLPGPGRPSPAWSELPPNERAVLRLPTTAAVWLHDVTPGRWLAVVGQGVRATRPAGSDMLLLDQRQHGAIEIKAGDDDVDVRTERCEGGADCEVTIGAGARHDRATFAAHLAH
jgi:hypothetical protein